jgi:hypothetical protein
VGADRSVPDVRRQIGRTARRRLDASHPPRLAGPIKAVTTTILNARRGICDCCGQPLP